MTNLGVDYFEIESSKYATRIRLWMSCHATEMDDIEWFAWLTELHLTEDTQHA